MSESKIVRNAPNTAGVRQPSAKMLARIKRLLPVSRVPVSVERSHTQQRSRVVTQKRGWFGLGGSRVEQVVETRVWTVKERF